MPAIECCVHDCYKSRMSKHRFPNPTRPGNTNLFEKWVNLCGNKRLKEEMTPEKNYTNCVVCALHFTPQDFGPNNVLKKGVWPSLNLPMIILNFQQFSKMSDNEQMEVEDENSNSSDDEEDRYTLRAEELERQLSSNKFLYDAHVEIVEIYRKLGDLNSMREAYQRFHACFPLTPKLWLDWIKDEIKIANSDTEQKLIFKLFDEAVEDYLSVDLWIEYAQYSIGVSDLDTTRSILERGLNAAGLHTAKGSLLWDTLRELEHVHVSLHKKDSEEWKAQVNRLNNVFKRQLSVPLLGMETTYNEWKEWYSSLPEASYDSKQVDWAYNKALKSLENYKPFEDRLLVGEEVYQVYMEYLEVVKDTSTKICLYERAIETLCLVPDIWISYCTYVFELGEIADKVSKRALRNCPWSEDLWIMRLRILECLSVAENDILKCFEEGIGSITPNPALELWISYLEYMHRNVKNNDKLDKLFDQAMEQLKDVDTSYKVSRWYSRTLAKRGDLKKMRQVWNGILADRSIKELASAWLEYAALERQYGDSDHVRALYKRALSSCTSWTQGIADEWLMYEREFGTLKQVMKCEEICKRYCTAVVKQEVQTAPAEMRYHKEDEKSIKRKRDETIPPKKGKFQKLLPTTAEEKPPPVQKHLDKDPKTTVFVSNLHHSVTSEILRKLFPNAKEIEIVYDRKGKSRCFGYMQFNKEQEALTALAQDRVPIDGRPVFISEIKPDKTERKPLFKYANTPEANKLFVKGLPLSKTKADIEALFKPYSPIDVRLIVKRNGESKGLAYIEFSNEQDAQRALKATDQMTIDDNLISVAISAPPPKDKNRDNVTTRSDQPPRNSKSRLQIPLIPRSLQIKSNTVTAPQSGETNGSSSLTAPPKSNADFRNMLLKK